MRCFRCVFPLNLDVWIIRIHEHADHGGFWNHLMQEFESLCPKVREVVAHAGGVTGGPVETDDQASSERVESDRKYNGNQRGHRLGRQRRRTAGWGENR